MQTSKDRRLAARKEARATHPQIVELRYWLEMVRSQSATYGKESPEAKEAMRKRNDLFNDCTLGFSRSVAAAADELYQTFSK